jgi:hypothetical protein
MVPAFLKRHRLAAAISCAVGLVAAGCADSAPTAPSAISAPSGPGVAASADATPAVSAGGGLNRALSQLRGATARYHDLAAAESDGFVLAAECEGGEVASVYVKPDRIDGTLDPSAPEGLLYVPTASGRPRLVGVELVLPYGYGGPEPPMFFGQPFQAEDEFGVWGLHVWIWAHNPTGMFAFSNPNVSCAE